MTTYQSIADTFRHAAAEYDDCDAFDVWEFPEMSDLGTLDRVDEEIHRALEAARAVETLLRLAQDRDERGCAISVAEARVFRATALEQAESTSYRLEMVEQAMAAVWAGARTLKAA